MITHDELTQKLYESWCEEAVKIGNVDPHKWDELSVLMKRCWSAVADAAWELVEGENAIWAAESNRRAEDLAGLLVEFVNRAEDILA